MLRHQSPVFDRVSFLSGPGEMAGRIRDFDWAGHPLGPPQDWPAELRSALGIALNSAFPTCIYWGSDLRLLYNDAWSHIPGPRHPGCLGEPAAEVWSDIWDIIEPQFSHAISTGAGVFFRDQMLPMRRYGVEEETYWTYNFTPIRLGDGSIGGIFNSGNETTPQVMQQKSTNFLLELGDLFRSTDDTDALCQMSLSLLGKHLDATRVGLREQRNGCAELDLPVIAQWSAEGVAPTPQDVARKGIAGAAWGELLDGRIIRLDGTDPTRRELEPTILANIGAVSALAVPWTDRGRTRSILFVHSGRERHWTPSEVRSVEAMLDQLMNALARARAASRERLMSREIDHRARNLLSVVKAVVRLARAEDPETMRSKLLDRLSSLAKNHTLLSGSQWDPVTLDQLGRQELAPYLDHPDARVTLSGPEIDLTPDTCQSIGMVLHELATNAAKYGALRGSGGALDMVWTLTDDQVLRIDWSETCAAPVENPGTTEGGFGSRLLHLMVELQLGGKLTREMSGDGMRCVIELPWADRHPSESVAADSMVP